MNGCDWDDIVVGMKNYGVLTPSKSGKPYIIRETTDINEAYRYLDICRKNFPKKKYVVEEIGFSINHEKTIIK